jgi:hypothetical protein
MYGLEKQPLACSGASKHGEGRNKQIQMSWRKSVQKKFSGNVIVFQGKTAETN